MRMCLGTSHHSLKNKICRRLTRGSQSSRKRKEEKRKERRGSRKIKRKGNEEE